MALLHAARDALNEAEAQLDAGRKKSAWKSAVLAGKILEDFRKRVRPPPVPDGPDPRQGELPYTRNLSDYVNVHGDEDTSDSLE